MHPTKLKEGNEREDMELNQIWRACRKIQSAIFRYNFDICSDLKQFDPECTGFVSESVFTGVMGKYRKVAALSDFELRDITDYFQIRDGRVAYRQFCKVVCSEDLLKNTNKDFTTGLEWNDPLHLNVLSEPEDRRKLCIILLKISQALQLPLMPYFQDYELVSQNVGVVTVTHFSRVLHFMKIQLSDADFLLLLKRYMKDAYYVNYVAFVKHLENIHSYLKSHKLLDHSSEVIKDFPGRLVDLELPQQPILDGCKLIHPIFPDTCNHTNKNRNQCDLVACVQNYVYKNSIRCSEFLECYDHQCTGCITKNQFQRGLYIIGLGKYMSTRDFEVLAERYRDPIDTNRIRYRNFCDEIEQVFTIKNLDKMPQMEVESPPKHIAAMARPGALEWAAAPQKLRDLCEETLSKITIRIRNRRLHLHPFFRNFDKLGSGHIQCMQLNKIFRNNGILLSDNEVESVLQRYGNELGFNYSKFLDEVDPADYAIPSLVTKQELQECPPFVRDQPAEDPENEDNIVRILSDVKRQQMTKGSLLLDFLTTYDRHREGEIEKSDFIRTIDNCNIKIPEQDAQVLCKLFESPHHATCVRYRDFCKALDEMFVKLESHLGDKVVTSVPLLHLANLDCVDCFLNFEERASCTQALMKLARKPDEISNLSQIFKDFDRANCGTVTTNQLMKALTVREMHHMVSRREFDAVCKCFAYQRGLEYEFNYRDFLKILDILFTTGQVKRNY